MLTNQCTAIVNSKYDTGDALAGVAEGDTEVKLNRTYREDVPLRSATPRLHKVKSNQRSGQTALDTVVELADLVRDLHQSLESYAPMWYTKTMDDRIRETLAAADSALHASVNRR